MATPMNISLCTSLLSRLTGRRLPEVLSSSFYTRRQTKDRKKPPKKLPLEVTPEYFEKVKQKKEYPNLWQGKKIEWTIDKLKAKGFCRPQKAYCPPEHVEETLRQLSWEVYGDKMADDWLRTSLADSLAKYKLLTKCDSQFSHCVPNPLLYTIQELGDLLEFYSTPVEEKTPYDSLVQNQAHLPPNLHVIPNPVRFHPEEDTLFGGISAYPGRGTVVMGLKTRKKYKGFQSLYRWPSV